MIAGTPSTPAPTPFCGSFRPLDCEFLLKPLRLEPTPIDRKERLIQSGERHYSEMLTPETLPSPAYLRLFRDLTETYARRLAEDVVSLAAHIAATRPAPLTVVSLARAGTPVGALLTRALIQRCAAEVRHYSISIIRDRGIDENALRYLLRALSRPPAGLVFVDGWTAKGVITRELKAALRRWNASNPERLDDRLYVLADIGGCADLAATYSDYAIPSGILNATVSGLVSRSVLNEQIGPADFHGCVYYDAFASADQTGWFLDRVSAHFQDATCREIPSRGREARAAATRAWLQDCMATEGITDLNLIKPGVAEATRVLLRRVPERLLVQDRAAPDLCHLLGLARERGVPVETAPAMPFLAAALIRSLRGAKGSDHPVRSNEP